MAVGNNIRTFPYLMLLSLLVFNISVIIHFLQLLLLLLTMTMFPYDNVNFICHNFFLCQSQKWILVSKFLFKINYLLKAMKFMGS